MKTQKAKYYSSGKLLLTGEYAVLHGADALVLPLRYGQEMEVEVDTEKTDGMMYWSASDLQGMWFRGKYRLSDFQYLTSNNTAVAKRLTTLLLKIRELNPQFLNTDANLSVKCTIQFNRQWGWGTSSTLLNNLAQWAAINAFELNREISNGSGYDIAAASQGQPFIYSNGFVKPQNKACLFQPGFRDKLLFVYLGQKQLSDSSVTAYLTQNTRSEKVNRSISDITQELVKVSNLDVFEHLLCEHEAILSAHLKQVAIQQQLFNDYPYVVKSLGAWGGDFVLFTHRGDMQEVENYLAQKGLETYFRYDELIAQ